MAVRMAPASYFRLVERFPLESIRDDAHLRESIAMLNRVLGMEEDRGTELYLDALSDLIELYEARLEPLGDVSEADVLRELMRQHGLTQEGLEAAVGITQSTISAVLNGKRSLTREQITTLADYFAVTPAAFLPASRPPGGSPQVMHGRDVRVEGERRSLGKRPESPRAHRGEARDPETGKPYTATKRRKAKGA